VAAIILLLKLGRKYLFLFFGGVKLRSLISFYNLEKQEKNKNKSKTKQKKLLAFKTYSVGQKAKLKCQDKPLQRVSV
jgi:hypothetical protein